MTCLIPSQRTCKERASKLGDDRDRRRQERHSGGHVSVSTVRSKIWGQRFLLSRQNLEVSVQDKNRLPLPIDFVPGFGLNSLRFSVVFDAFRAKSYAAPEGATAKIEMTTLSMMNSHA